MYIFIKFEKYCEKPMLFEEAFVAPQNEFLIFVSMRHLQTVQTTCLM